MKRTLNFLVILMTLWDIVEMLFLPTVFLVLGIWNDLPWQYYAITIGGYFVLFLIVEIVLHFIFKKIERKYTPFIVRKLKKHFDMMAPKEK